MMDKCEHDCLRVVEWATKSDYMMMNREAQKVDCYSICVSFQWKEGKATLFRKDILTSLNPLNCHADKPGSFMPALHQFHISLHRFTLILRLIIAVAADI